MSVCSSVPGQDTEPWVASLVSRFWYTVSACQWLAWQEQSRGPVSRCLTWQLQVPLPPSPSEQTPLLLQGLYGWSGHSETNIQPCWQHNRKQSAEVSCVFPEETEAPSILPGFNPLFGPLPLPSSYLCPLSLRWPSLFPPVCTQFYSQRTKIHISNFIEIKSAHKNPNWDSERTRVNYERVKVAWIPGPLVDICICVRGRRGLSVKLHMWLSAHFCPADWEPAKRKEVLIPAGWYASCRTEQVSGVTWRTANPPPALSVTKNISVLGQSWRKRNHRNYVFWSPRKPFQQQVQT